MTSQPGPRWPAAPTEDKLAPWGDQIYQWLTGDRLQLTRIEELLSERDCRVSYASLLRFVDRRNWRRRSRVTVRMEDTAPGEVAEVDFGRLGLIHDPDTGRRRTVWALIVVLGYSRHCFLWPTHGQKLEDVIAGLESAWGLLRRHSQVPGDRQLSAGGGDSGCTASLLHQGIPGILPAPRLHHRRSKGTPSQGQAQ